jgi:hypothetical protein
MKSFLSQNSTMGWLDFFVAVLAIIALSYEISEYLPSESLIILEVEELETPFAYSLTGADSDQNYLLESVKIYPHLDHPIKRATFKYDHYVKEVDLKVSQKEQPNAYFVSKEFLQHAFEEQSFHFEFLDDNRFTFKFYFDEGQSGEPEFECKAIVVDKSVPCQVVEKSLVSSWYYTMGFSVFILIALVIFLPIRFFIWRRSQVYGYDNTPSGYGN